MSELRAKLPGSLATLAVVYAEHGPRVNVPSNGLDVKRGDVVTLHDAAGNELTADVVGIEFVAIPRMDTLRNPRAEARQTTLDTGEAA